MTTFVTIYDTVAEEVATETQRVRVSGGDPDVPAEYEHQPVRSLGRLALASGADAAWTRPGWLNELNRRLAPKAAGAENFAASWVILSVVEVKPVPDTGQKLSAGHDGGVADLEAGTMTYTWSLVDIEGVELTAAVTAATSAKEAAINTERGRRIYLPIGPIDVAGDGSKMVEPDIRNDHDRANLGDIHTRALQLKVAGVTTAVFSFGAADNNTYALTPDEALALTSAPFDRAAAIWQKSRDLKDGALAAAVAAEDLAAIAAIDPTDDAHWT